MVSGQEASKSRWSGYVEKSVAGSVHAAEMPFVDEIATGALSGAGLRAPGIGQVSLRGKGGRNPVADEERVARSSKQGRVMKVAPAAPPKDFNAGSVLDRTTSLIRPALDSGVRMAFGKPDIAGREIQIAAAFHTKAAPKQDRLIPAQLAALITSDKADILATAYAPPAADYAKASPFTTLLLEEPENAGRFIPPLGKGDHAWMSNPLPPLVFTEAEQTCLATAIYFEARGENMRGQAAVAQVILNRVRSPAYPDTICGVVYQNASWKNRCQFSFACDGIKDRITNRRIYDTAEEVALAVTAGKIFISEVGSSTHYHATYVTPRWSATMEKMKKIGLHIFYRTHGGGWS